SYLKISQPDIVSNRKHQHLKIFRGSNFCRLKGQLSLRSCLESNYCNRMLIGLKMCHLDSKSMLSCSDLKTIQEGISGKRKNLSYRKKIQQSSFDNTMIH